MKITEEQKQELKEFLSTLGAYLPDNKAPYVWDLFNHLRGENEPRPCTCASSGAHWKRAIDFLYDWIKHN
jgi:hypothetical protein